MNRSTPGFPVHHQGLEGHKPRWGHHQGLGSKKVLTGPSGDPCLEPKTGEGWLEGGFGLNQGFTTRDMDTSIHPPEFPLWLRPWGR